MGRNRHFTAGRSGKRIAGRLRQAKIAMQRASTPAEVAAAKKELGKAERAADTAGMYSDSKGL